MSASDIEDSVDVDVCSSKETADNPRDNNPEVNNQGEVCIFIRSLLLHFLTSSRQVFQNGQIGKCYAILTLYIILNVLSRL